MNSVMITVFTPSYNRAYILNNLYESLKKQTYKEFEWLVVDDGSTDNTESLVRSFIDDGKIAINYIKKENGGKPAAINLGVQSAKGKLFFIVDSDDYLTEDALEKIALWEDSLPKEEKFAGVSGKRGYPDGKMIGTTFAGEYLDCTNLESDIRHIISGDQAEAYYTEVLKQFPFPVFEGERYVPLYYVWYGISNAGYKIRYFNQIIYICEYLNDGLTHKYQSLLDKNPKGTAAYKIKECEYFHYTAKEKVNSYYQYYKQFKNKITKREIAENLHCSLAYIYWMIIRFRVRDAIKGESYQR